MEAVGIDASHAVQSRPEVVRGAALLGSFSIVAFPVGSVMHGVHSSTHSAAAGVVQSMVDVVDVDVVVDCGFRVYVVYVLVVYVLDVCVLVVVVRVRVVDVLVVDVCVVLDFVMVVLTNLVLVPV